jgi:hypothetical protein
MFGALIHTAEQWKTIKVTEFERRQIIAVRKETDQEYEAPGRSQYTTLKGCSPAKLSSNPQT